MGEINTERPGTAEPVEQQQKQQQGRESQLQYHRLQIQHMGRQMAGLFIELRLARIIGVSRRSINAELRQLMLGLERAGTKQRKLLTKTEQDHQQTDDQ